METWFFSDAHFYHKRAIEMCNRPFSSLEEMNEGLIKNINSLVKKNDIFYYLGDLAFAGPEVVEKLFNRLNGQWYYIIGNHDKWVSPNFMKSINKIKWWGDQKDIKINGQYITLNHYMMNVWNKSHYGAWHLYGHSHFDVSEHSNGKTMNVCADLINYFPVNFEQVKSYMETRPSNWNMVDKKI